MTASEPPLFSQRSCLLDKDGTRPANLMPPSRSKRDSINSAYANNAANAKKSQSALPQFDQAKGDFFFETNKPPVNFHTGENPYRLLASLWEHRPEYVGPKQHGIKDLGILRTTVMRIKERCQKAGYSIPIDALSQPTKAGYYRLNITVDKMPIVQLPW